MDHQESTGIIIQARMGSHRLPGKVLMPLAGNPILSWVVERSRLAKCVDHVIVATTDLPQDDVIESFCRDRKFPVFRGSETDVLQRYVDCAKTFKIDHVVRITADCPFIEPSVIDGCVRRYIESNADYVQNTRLKKTFPRGLDVEVCSYELLRKISSKQLKNSEREHVTLYIYHHENEYRIETLEAGEEHQGADLRLTVDTPEDYAFCKRITEHFRSAGLNLRVAEVIKFVYANTDIAGINKHIEQKPINGLII